MIVDGLIVCIQAGLLLLLALLAMRMMALVRSEPLVTGPQRTCSNTGNSIAVHRSDRAYRIAKEPTADKKPVVDTAPDRAELLTRLHILAGLQHRDCRANCLDLSNAPEAVKVYGTAWLYGAASVLCARSTPHSEMLVNIVAQIASRKLGIRQSEAIEAMDTLTASAVHLACFRAGVEGAEFWLQNKYVPTSASLYEVITANAFI
ncbi:hypothetical protein [Marinobacter sp. F3R08]|uniref:hypothetical protein n=1 Tax=Marinobacter sp. F3R08 TaxID=2841559 RepID=UPI001C08871A|nr:hypothetical protein [Marinobacter sp. F3R08]MBU2955774.1 hypothetical protein [Marinobacter sp. F3R08]